MRSKPAGRVLSLNGTLPSRRVLLEGGYEAGEAMKYFTSILHPGPFAPNVEERLIGRVHELVREVEATTRK